MKNINIVRPALLTLALLLIPLFGNNFDDGWNWSLSDFVIMGGIIFVTGFLIEFANVKIKNKNHRFIAVSLILLALLIIWAHLAVGIVDTWPLAGS